MTDPESLTQNQETQNSEAEQILGNMPDFDPENANREVSFTQLEKAISDIETSETFDQDKEYNISFEDYNFSPSSVLKNFNKTAIDLDYDTIGLKYDDELCATAGIDEDIHDDARHDALLKSLNNGSLSQYDHFDSDGFSMFDVKYSLDDYKNAHYTADFLMNKNIPISMTTATVRAILEQLKTPEQTPENNLADLAAKEIADGCSIDIKNLQKAAANHEIIPELDEDSEGYAEDDLFTDDYDRWDLARDVLNSLHTKWAKDNEEKFFDPQYSNKLYQFLDVNILPDNDLQENLFKETEPLFHAINVDTNYIRPDSSERFDGGFYEEEGIDGLGLARTLLENPASVLANPKSQKIIAAIKSNPSLALAITEQVGFNCFNEDRDWSVESIAEELGLDYEKFDKEFHTEKENDPYFTSDEYINDGWN